MSNETKLGVFFLFGIFLLVVVFELLGGVSIFEKRYQLNTAFNSIGELKIGNPVKLAGFEVGRVKKIELEGNKIVINMDVKQDAVIKEDSIASIKLTSLLGISYINISFGSPESTQIPDGYTLQSEDFIDFNEIMKQLETTVSSLDTIFSKISEGEGTLGLLVHDDSLYNETNSAAKHLNQILERINKGEGTIGKLVTDDSLYYDTKSAAAKLNRAIDTQEDLAPLQTIATVFGILAVF